MKIPPNILFAALEAMMSGTASQKECVRVVGNPQHTRNLFGPIEEIAGKSLAVVDKNPEGDCLCVFTGRCGTNLVDVDRRDIEANAIGEARAESATSPHDQTL
jgi:hypothetical protein